MRWAGIYNFLDAYWADIESYNMHVYALDEREIKKGVYIIHVFKRVRVCELCAVP